MLDRDLVHELLSQIFGLLEQLPSGAPPSHPLRISPVPTPGWKSWMRFACS